MSTTMEALNASKPVPVGAEMRTLARFLADCRWQRETLEGEMGPRSPALFATGHTTADNYGHAEILRGRIEGDLLTFETLTDDPIRLPLVWDASVPGAIRRRNEISVAGGHWSTVESYECGPLVDDGWDGG